MTGRGWSRQPPIAAGAPLLERFAWVYVECSFMELYAGQSFADEVIAWLRERGLRLIGVYHMAYDGEGVDRGGGAAPTGRL